MSKFIVITSFLLSVVALAQAQNSERNYTDHKPEYRKWQDSYILDKIEYTPDATIFFFRFICNNARSGGAVFYPPQHRDAWFLKGKNVERTFPMLAVKNVRKDGVLIKKEVTQLYQSDPSGPIGYTIFSCEVHFGALDNEMRVADLIEGRGQEYNRRHFNCFNIKLKTWDAEDLGTEADSRETIAQFEEKTGKSTLNNVSPPDKKEVPKVNQRPDSKEAEYKAGTFYLSKAQDLLCDEVMILGGINFQDNSTNFSGTIKARQTLDWLIAYLKEHPQASITIFGHTDIHGNKEKNLDLSKARAYKIQRWLSMYGIHPKRITCKWYGPDRPIYPEGDPRNRRVEARLDCP
jgi:outer membrane protein OmpA-like peptidoglycan-associated protein